MKDLLKHSTQNWQNLIELYENISSSNPDFTHTEQPFKSIFSKQYAWPNFTILDSSSDDVGRLSRSLNEGICKNEVSPVILVHPSMSDNYDLTQAFDEYGIRQIAQWPIMYFELDGGMPELAPPTYFSVHQVVNHSQLVEWGTIVSSVLFKDKKLDLLRFLSDDFCLFIGYVGSKPVAASLAFLGSVAASSHMVAVLPEYRKKGYGKHIMNSALEISKSKGYSVCYCQSSQMGYVPWLELGYMETGGIDLYWKVGQSSE